MTTAINITEAMLSLMAEEPRRGIDMAEVLDCTLPQIVRRVRRLERDRKIQRQRVNNRKGFYFLWYIAVPGRTLPTIFRDEPKASDLELEEELPGAGQPIRKFVSTWEPIKLRNEFETFLFGPAHMEAA